MTQNQNLLRPLFTACGSYLQWIYDCWRKELSNNIPYEPIEFKGLRIPIGENIKHTVYYEPTKSPHLLVSGVTGSGKSVFIKSLLTSIINNISCEIYTIDLKIVELALFKNCNKVKEYIYDVKLATELIANLLEECHNRYKLFFEYGVTNLKDYNKVTNGKKLKYQFIIIEEFVAFNDKNGMKLLRELVSLSRSSGQFLILSCQRPDRTVIDGVLKANIDNRVAFKTTDSKNSVIILDSEGAEEIDTVGRFLYKHNAYIELCQGYNILDEQIKSIVSNHLKPIKESKVNTQVKDKQPKSTKISNENKSSIKLNKL